MLALPRPWTPGSSPTGSLYVMPLAGLEVMSMMPIPADAAELPINIAFGGGRQYGPVQSLCRRNRRAGEDIALTVFLQ